MGEAEMSDWAAADLDKHAARPYTIRVIERNDLREICITGIASADKYPIIHSCCR